MGKGGLRLQVVLSRAAMDELNDLRLSDGPSATMDTLVCVRRVRMRVAAEATRAGSC